MLPTGTQSFYQIFVSATSGWLRASSVPVDTPFSAQSDSMIRGPTVPVLVGMCVSVCRVYNRTWTHQCCRSSWNIARVSPEIIYLYYQQIYLKDHTKIKASPSTIFQFKDKKVTCHCSGSVRSVNCTKRKSNSDDSISRNSCDTSKARKLPFSSFSQGSEAVRPRTY